MATTYELKKCKGCDQEKLHARYASGLRNRCVDCRKKEKRDYAKTPAGKAGEARRHANPAFLAWRRERDAERKKDPQVREEFRSRQRAYKQTDKGRIAEARYQRGKYQTPGGRRMAFAHAAVNAAIVAGLLTRPEVCDRCGGRPLSAKDGRSLIHFHHTHGYAKKNWLRGDWRCHTCHREIHAESDDARRMTGQEGVK